MALICKQLLVGLGARPRLDVDRRLWAAADGMRLERSIRGRGWVVQLPTSRTPETAPHEAAHYDRLVLAPRRFEPPPLGVLRSVNAFLAKVVAWITAGYPDGVPGADRVPLLALLERRLSNDEVKQVARALIARGEFDHIDIGVTITEITDELPKEDDVERVRRRLIAKGWPLDDPRDGGSA